MSTLSKPEFARQLRQALQNLHDFAALQKLPLTGVLSGDQQTLDQSVRQLRAEILATIEQLNPPGRLPNRAKERRPYTILYGRYVQGMNTAELVAELALSVRQLRREQARAVAAITDLMWARLGHRLNPPTLPEPGQIPNVKLTDSPPPVPEHQAATWTEAEQLISQSRVETLTLSTLLSSLVATLAPVAAGRGLGLEQRFADDLPPVRANRVVLRQGVMELISSALRRLASGQVVIESVPDPASAPMGAPSPGLMIRVRITASGDRQLNVQAQTSLEVSQRLIASLGGGIDFSETPDRWQAVVWLPTAEDWPILVMDDNAGLIELFRRYLAGRSYRVVEAHSPAEAVELARQMDLKLIVLDVMLPGQDGWEVLQQLRAAPETRDLPILICSALSEPEIAYTLGASDYLTKPVTQDELLTKVEHWCQPPGALPGVRPPELPAVRPPGSPVDSSTSPSGKTPSP